MKCKRPSRHTTGLCPRAEDLSQTWRPLHQRHMHWKTGRGPALRSNPGNLLPGAENQLQVPTLSANDQIISVFQKLSMCCCVQTLLTSCWECPTCFLQVSSAPFQVSALMTSCLATFPLLSYLSGMAHLSTLLEAFLYLLNLHTHLDNLNKTKEQIQILTRFYFPHYNCNSCHFSRLIPYQSWNSCLFSQSLEYTSSLLC